MPAPSHGILDATCPVEWGHPLNYGLLGEWAAPPLSGWRGGLTLYDLVRGAKSPHNGTLTAGPVWSGGAQPGGYGSLKFTSASSQYVTCGTLNSFNLGTSGWTLAAWLRPTTFGTGTQPVVMGKVSSSTVFAGLITSNASGNQIQAVSKGRSGTDTIADGGLNSLVTGAWHFYAGTCTSGGVGTVYRDGAQLATATGTGTGPALSTQNLTLGGNPAASTGFANGLADGFLLYNRVLPLADLQALYLETKAGNPNRWRWLSPTAYSFPSSAAAGTPYGWEEWDSPPLRRSLRESQYVLPR